jgi:hypothetical protein
VEVALKLHRCGNIWVKLNGHPCWRVQKALDDVGVEYEIVKEPWPSRKKRTAFLEHTGQTGLPAIELEDGTWYRKDSSEMATEIRAGKFSGGAGGGAAPPAEA